MDQELDSKQAVSHTTGTDESPERSDRHPTPGGDDGAPARQELSRRSFLKTGIGVLSTLAAIEIGAAGILFLRSRSLEEGAGGVVTAGAVDSFSPGSVTEFPDAGFFLIRSPDGGFMAVSQRCPHLGCTVEWLADRNRFLCPCHASSFDFFGNFESPPVPRPLDTFAVQIEETTVKVDTSRPQRRESFIPEQLAYA